MKSSLHLLASLLIVLALFQGGTDARSIKAGLLRPAVDQCLATTWKACEFACQHDEDEDDEDEENLSDDLAIFTKCAIKFADRNCQDLGVPLAQKKRFGQEVAHRAKILCSSTLTQWSNEYVVGM